MKRDLADHDLFIAQVRAQQAMNPEAHDALINWGAYSRDRRGLGPIDAVCKTWEQHTGDTEGYGDAEAVETAPVKAEGPEHEPYDLKSAELLDARLHGPGGPTVTYREILKVLYVHRVPEWQCPRLAGRISDDEFRYRLGEVLSFVRRFV